MPDNGPACRHVVHTIIRLRSLDGSEKLYSLGELIGYDGASIRRSIGCNKPETWESVKFGYEKTYNQKTRRFDIYSTGPIGNEIKYLILKILTAFLKRPGMARTHTLSLIGEILTKE